MGCGGGGGGSGGGGDQYSGSTAAAEVNENNVTEIAAGAFAAGQTGTVMTGSEASQDAQETAVLGSDHFRTLNVPRILGDAARSMDLRPYLHQWSANEAANQTESGIGNGPCGGSYTYTVTVNTNSGAFSGSFIFSSYCDNGVTISGKATISGTANPETGDIITITFSFTNLSDDTMRMNGKISMDYSDSPILCTSDCLLKDKRTGKTYWAKNYSLNIYEYPDRIEFEIFGKFYHPDYGFVEVSTEEPFVIFDGDDWPSSGILLMLGANNTRAKLEAIDETQCRIEADTDGDGVYDWFSEPLDWSDLHTYDEIEISGSYVQYRTFSDAAENRYQGWISFLNDGQPIKDADIVNIDLFGPDQNEVDITLGDF